MRKKSAVWIIALLLLPLPLLLFYGLEYSKRKTISPCFRKDITDFERRECAWKYDPFLVSSEDKLEHVFGSFLGKMADDLILLKARSPLELPSKMVGKSIESRVILIGVKSPKNHLTPFRVNPRLKPAAYSLSLLGIPLRCFEPKIPMSFKVFKVGAKFKVDSFIGLPNGQILIQLVDDNGQIVDIDQESFKRLTQGCDSQGDMYCRRYNPYEKPAMSSINGSILLLTNKVPRIWKEDVQSLINSSAKRLIRDLPLLKVSQVSEESGNFKGVVSGIPDAMNILQQCQLFTKNEPPTHTTKTLKDEWGEVLSELEEKNKLFHEYRPSRDALKEAEKFYEDYPEMIQLSPFI